MRFRLLVKASLLTCVAVSAQTPVSQVILSSTLTQRSIGPTSGNTPAVGGSPVKGTLPRGLLSVYTWRTAKEGGSSINIDNPLDYDVANTSALTSVISTNIAVALSDIPLASPTSGVIVKKDPVTGAELPVSGTLGPIFTQRAETVGKGKVYVGFTHQNYHFTSINGMDLNGVSVMYAGGNESGIPQGFVASNGPSKTAPATINLGLDVRLVQDIGFLTFGITDRLDVSVGLPAVHASVASTAYNGVIYSGTGTDFNTGNQCWCVNTFTPGAFSLSVPGAINAASAGQSGFGDLLLRVKGGVIQRANASLALGADVRFPTGDAKNYLGTGATSVKPFAALSLYSAPRAHGIVFAPHFEAGWQFSGKSILGGPIQGTRTTVDVAGIGQIPIVTAPFTMTKDYLPSILSWGAGTEVAFGRSNTAVIDFFGNHVGLVHGIPTLESRSTNLRNTNPPPADVLAGAVGMPSGLAPTGTRGSFSQYGGAFGYKVRIVGNLVATAQALVRFDNNGLVARVTPLYGLGYSFGR